MVGQECPMEWIRRTDQSNQNSIAGDTKGQTKLGAERRSNIGVLR